jgi:DNA-binding winged helix-turn-helix (wHTH) protein
MSLLFTLIGRAKDVEAIRGCALNGTCVSLVGISNLGKSALMRHLCEFSAPDHRGTFVYVDCNAMPERTARAFFIAIWRALADKLQTCCDDGDVVTRARHLNGEIIDADDAATFALNFERGLALSLDSLPRPLVLCLDDFDEVYQSLELQAFLNLRAFKDRYGDALAYITATERELAHLTNSREQGELLELVTPHVHFLSFMATDDTREFCRRFAAREGVTFSDADIAFICDNVGGHPGLALAVCHALGSVTGAPMRNAQQDRVIHQIVQQNLATDVNVRVECEKIWQDLETDERNALLSSSTLRGAPSGAASQDAALRGLRAKFIVQDSDEGLAIFSRLFADFVRRQQLAKQPHARGVYIDVDAGTVFVEGKPAAALTDLEYRLLLFLYGRLDRVCDKYSIVESVWGEEYIDEVDDARIEKLVSRVRAKIELDPTHPKYLLSLRGRGYKLVR